ncbi:11188_t:CDS:2, partial [Entrophospora sp. SA101]
SLLTETEKRDGDYDNESVEEKIGDNKAASIVPDTAIPILTATTTVIDHDNEHNEIVKEPNLDLNQKSDSSTQNIDDDQEAFSTEKDTTTLDEKDIDPDEKDAGLNEKEPIPEEPKLDPKEEFEIFTGKVKEFQENVLEPLKSSNKDMVSTIKNLLSKKCPKHLSDRQSDFEKKFDYLMDRVELGKNVLEQCDAINDFLNQAKDIIDWVNPHLEFLGKILKDDTLGELNEDKLHDLLEEVNKVESGKQAYTDVYELAKNLATVQLKKAEIDDLWQELQEAIPKTKQQLDQALQIVDFKEKIKETISKVENLSDIISSSLVDQVTKDNINDWQTELNDLEQTELSSLVKLHDNIQESLSTNDGAMNKKERAILENLLKSVEDKINDLKKLMDDKIDEVEAHRSAEITGAYLTRVNDLQSWIKGQFEDFLSGKSQHGIMVCGLKWNPEGTQLASGGNDNMLLIWDKSNDSPIYKFLHHTAAVKAIAWSPHSHGLLASGGGTQDKHIRFWSTTTGEALESYDTESQVCNLAWSRHANEIVSTHGYSQNQIILWKYPSMEQLAVLKGHSFRVLYLSVSPDGQNIVTGAGDETLRFWNIFNNAKKEPKRESFFNFRAKIR